MMKILLGITGSIAAYKSVYLVRDLCKQGFEVAVVLTQAARSFVTPLTLQALANQGIYEELLDPKSEAAMDHISLARWADVILIAPASAHCIAKLAHGLSDDLLSTLCLATNKPIIVAPAMNQQMWMNSATQTNVQTLIKRGVLFFGPDKGVQACGEEGLGRMLEPDEIIEQLISLQQSYASLKDKHILITAGPTHEPLDPVRYFSNRSSGKMGYAMAKAAIDAGAKVTLISGPVTLSAPFGCKIVHVKTAEEMLRAVKLNVVKQDVFISAAAIADYRIIKPNVQKIKKRGAHLVLDLEKTPDILSMVCKMSARPFTVGFAAETENVVDNAEKKRVNKGVDLMVANDVSLSDIGFESDDNAVSVLSDSGRVDLKKAAKIEIARQLLSIIDGIMPAVHKQKLCV